MKITAMPENGFSGKNFGDGMPMITNLLTHRVADFGSASVATGQASKSARDGHAAPAMSENAHYVNSHYLDRANINELPTPYIHCAMIVCKPLMYRAN